MKLIILNFIIIYSISFATQDLDRPTKLRVSALEPVGLFVQWRIVQDYQSNPIIGYKVRLWEIEEDLHGSFTSLDEDLLVIVSDERSVETYNIEKNPKHQPREFLSPLKDIKNDQNIKISDNIKYNTLYEVRVLAYRLEEDGPMSEPVRVKVVKGDDYTVIAQRHSSACTVTVASNTTPENGELYYHLESVYL